MEVLPDEDLDAPQMRLTHRRFRASKDTLVAFEGKTEKLDDMAPSRG